MIRIQQSLDPNPGSAKPRPGFSKAWIRIRVQESLDPDPDSTKPGSETLPF
jgi:hypothetical protein